MGRRRSRTGLPRALSGEFPPQPCCPQAPAEPEQGRAREQKGKAQKKKEQRPDLPRKRGPKCARPGEKERRGWRAKGNRRVTGERGDGKGERQDRTATCTREPQAARQGGRAPMGGTATLGSYKLGSTDGDGSAGTGAEPAPPGSMPHCRSPAHREQGNGAAREQRRAPGPVPPQLRGCKQGARGSRGTSSAPHSCSTKPAPSLCGKQLLQAPSTATPRWLLPPACAQNSGFNSKAERAKRAFALVV